MCAKYNVGVVSVSGHFKNNHYMWMRMSEILIILFYFFYFFVRLFVYILIYYFFIYLFVYLFIFFCLFVCLFIYLFTLMIIMVMTKMIKGVVAAGLWFQDHLWFRGASQQQI